MNKIGIYATGLFALTQPAALAAQPASFPEALSSQPVLSQPVLSQPVQQNSPHFHSSDLGLQFDLSNSTPIPAQIQGSDYFQMSPAKNQPNVKSSAASNLFQQATFTLRQLFSKDTDSLVAVAVGNAEGTRTPAGDRSQHFYGHADPGNGVWNLGTFSYQHGADSAEAADAKQLERLKRQAQVMQEKASAHGLKLTLAETLNGIDLANQAPQALLDVAGYIDWLAQAQNLGMSGSEAILWARVQSFIDPKTQRWNAPGLGNNAESITRDQQRRMQAIARAIQHQNDSIAADARLNPQPIGLRLRRSLAQRLMQQFSAWFS